MPGLKELLENRDHKFDAVIKAGHAAAQKALQAATPEPGRVFNGFSLLLSQAELDGDAKGPGVVQLMLELKQQIELHIPKIPGLENFPKEQPAVQESYRNEYAEAISQNLELSYRAKVGKAAKERTIYDPDAKRSEVVKDSAKNVFGELDVSKFPDVIKAREVLDKIAEIGINALIDKDQFKVKKEVLELLGLTQEQITPAQILSAFIENVMRHILQQEKLNYPGNVYDRTLIFSMLAPVKNMKLEEQYCEYQIYASLQPAILQKQVLQDLEQVVNNGEQRSEKVKHWMLIRKQFILEEHGPSAKAIETALRQFAELHPINKTQIQGVVTERVNQIKKLIGDDKPNLEALKEQVLGELKEEKAANQGKKVTAQDWQNVVASIKNQYQVDDEYKNIKDSAKAKQIVTVIEYGIFEHLAGAQKVKELVAMLEQHNSKNFADQFQAFVKDYLVRANSLDNAAVNFWLDVRRELDNKGKEFVANAIRDAVPQYLATKVPAQDQASQDLGKTSTVLTELLDDATLESMIKHRHEARSKIGKDAAPAATDAKQGAQTPKEPAPAANAVLTSRTRRSS